MFNCSNLILKHYALNANDFKYFVMMIYFIYTFIVIKCLPLHELIFIKLLVLINL